MSTVSRIVSAVSTVTTANETSLVAAGGAVSRIVSRTPSRSVSRATGGAVSRMVSRTSLFAAGVIVALLAAACDDPKPPAPTPDRGATAALTASATASASASASASTTADVAPTASATTSADAAPSASGDPSAAPSGVASAAPSGSASASPVVKGFAFPAPKSGILTPADADKLAPSGARAKVRLLDAGKEPLAALTYAPTKGARQALRVDLGTKVALVSGGQPIASGNFPPQALDVDVSTEEADAESGALVSMLLQGITAQAKDGVDQSTADLLTKQLAGLSGYTVRERVGAHGDATDMKVVVPEAFPKGAEQLLQNISSIFRSLVPRLPDEPVGVGAKWQVLSREEAPGASFVQLTDYTLKARSGTKLTIDFQARQLAAGDAIKLPAGLAEGQTMKMMKFVTTITGTLGLDTTQMGPEKGRSAQDAKLTFLVTGPASKEPDAGAAEPIKVDVDMKMNAVIGRRAAGGSASASAAPTATAAPAPTKP